MNREELFKAGRFDLTKMTTEEIFRQSGRTTRMVNDAIATAKKGSKVVIVMKDLQQVAKVEEIVKGVPNVEVTHYNTISKNFPVPFDWNTLKGIGKYEKHKVFIDHEVIYFNNRLLMEAASKYDPKFDIVGDTMTFRKE